MIVATLAYALASGDSSVARVFQVNGIPCQAIAAGGEVGGSLTIRSGKALYAEPIAEWLFAEDTKIIVAGLVDDPQAKLVVFAYQVPNWTRFEAFVVKSNRILPAWEDSTRNPDAMTLKWKNGLVASLAFENAYDRPVPPGMAPETGSLCYHHVQEFEVSAYVPWRPISDQWVLKSL
jgi:hypothetical protein